MFKDILNALLQWIFSIIADIMMSILKVVDVLAVFWETALSPQSMIDLITGKVDGMTFSPLAIYGIIVGIAVVGMAATIGIKAIKNLIADKQGHKRSFMYLETAGFNIGRLLIVPTMVVMIIMSAGLVSGIFNGLIGQTNEFNFSSQTTASVYQLKKDILDRNESEKEYYEGLIAAIEKGFIYGQDKGEKAIEALKDTQTKTSFSSEYYNALTASTHIYKDKEENYRASVNRANAFRKGGILDGVQQIGILNAVIKTDSGWELKLEYQNNTSYEQLCLNIIKYKDEIINIEKDCVNIFEDDNIIKNFYEMKSGNLGYIIAMIAIAIIYTVATIRLLAKYFGVVLLFLVSPFPLCAGVIDDNKRYGIWWDTMLAEVLGLFAMTLSMSIFFALQTPMTTLLTGGSKDSFLALIVTLAGLTFASKGGQKIAQLIGAHMSGEGSLLSPVAHMMSPLMIGMSRMMMVGRAGKAAKAANGATAMSRNAPTTAATSASNFGNGAVYNANLVSNNGMRDSSQMKSPDIKRVSSSKNFDGGKVVHSKNSTFNSQAVKDKKAKAAQHTTNKKTQ